MLIAQRSRHRDINGERGPINEAWVAALCAHGTYLGITKRTLRYPNVVRHINSFMKSVSHGCWSSFSLAKNIHTDVRVDCHNDKDFPSIAVSFGDFDGGQLWVAQSGDESSTWKRDRHGRNSPGTGFDSRDSKCV